MEQEALQRLVTEAAREVRRGTSEDGVRGSHVLTLVNVILDTALEEEATDIHLEPMGGRLRIRMRVDGLLQENPVQFPAELAPVIIARLKVMAGIDTAKRNRPQDGQIRYVHGGRTIDMRAAVLPVVWTGSVWSCESWTRRSVFSAVRNSVLHRAIRRSSSS